MPTGAGAAGTGEPVRLLDYGRFPASAKKNANWLYVSTSSTRPGRTRDCRITLKNPSSVVTMWTGLSKPKSYTRLSRQMIEENGKVGDRDFLTNGLYDSYERTCEYWDVTGNCAYLGSDRVGGGKNPILKPNERLDRGLSYPRQMKVGETVKSSTDYYEKGVYLGQVPYSVTLVSRGPLTVPAGRFEDCVQVRVSVGPADRKSIVDEWWAKGVGVVKIKGVRGYGETFNLVAYNLKGDSLMVPGKILVTSMNSVPTLSGGVEMSFPSIPYGESSAEEIFTIRNRGDGPLEITRRPDSGSVGGFEINGLPTKFALAAGQSLEFTVRFTPNSPSMSSYINTIPLTTADVFDGIVGVKLYGISSAPAPLGARK